MAKKTNRRKLNTGERYDEKKNLYIYRIMKNGKRVSCTAKTLEELRVKENQLKVNIDNGEAEKAKEKEARENITLNACFDKWYESALNGKRKPSTMTNYVSYYNTYIKNSIGENRIIDIKKSDLDGIFTSMRKSGKSHSTFANLRSLLRHIFDWAVEDDYIAKILLVN